MPLLLVCCLSCAEVDALSPEFCSTARLRRATEDVRLPGDLEVNESCATTVAFSFCFQQSTGNSARPQIDLLFASSGTACCTRISPIWRRPLGLSTRGHLLQGSQFVWQQIEDAVGDTHIGQPSGTG